MIGSSAQTFVAHVRYYYFFGEFGRTIENYVFVSPGIDFFDPQQEFNGVRLVNYSLDGFHMKILTSDQRFVDLLKSYQP